MGSLGEYDVQGKLAEGGLGIVYEATQRATGLPVVLKRAKTELHQSWSRLLDEGRLGQRLNGLAFVETLDVFEAPTGGPVVVLERIRGTTLLEIVRRGGKMPFELAARVGAEVCQALAVLHVLRGENGAPLKAVHRDISIRNIMVEESGRVRVIDLGASLFSSEEREAHSTTGMVIGTLSYLPPEVFDGADDTSARDIWATGVTILECAIGGSFAKKRPAAMESTGDALQRVKARVADPFASPEVQALHPRLLSVLKQMLTSDPAKRIDAQNAAADLFAMSAGRNQQEELAARVRKAVALPSAPKPRSSGPGAEPASEFDRTTADSGSVVSAVDDGPTTRDVPLPKAGLEDAATLPQRQKRELADAATLPSPLQAASDLSDPPTMRDTGTAKIGLTKASSPDSPDELLDGPSALARSWPTAPILHLGDIPTVNSNVFTSMPEDVAPAKQTLFDEEDEEPALALDAAPTSSVVFAPLPEPATDLIVAVSTAGSKPPPLPHDPQGVVRTEVVSRPTQTDQIGDQPRGFKRLLRFLGL